MCAIFRSLAGLGAVLSGISTAILRRGTSSGNGSKLHGSFAAGGRIVMTPIGQEAIELRIAEALEPVLFVDEANLDHLVIRTTHRVERVRNERSRVTYRMEINGPAADTLGPQLGPAITADFPETLAALVARAEAPSTDPSRARA